MDYMAGFVLDAGNNIHLFYVNNYANKAWHLERMAEGWKRELVEPVNDPVYLDFVQKVDRLFPWPHLLQAGMENGRLCAYLSYGGFSKTAESQVLHLSYLACRGVDGGWTFTKINDKVPFQPFLLVNDQEMLKIVRDTNSDTFSLINRMTGAEREFLAPVDFTFFPPYVSEGSQLDFYFRGIIPVYDKGQWDGIRFIYCVPLIKNRVFGDNYVTEKVICYLTAYQGNNWQIEKILELPNNGSPGFGTNGQTYQASTIIFWKDRIINTLGADFFLGKDSVTGALITEPIPPSYLTLFESLEHSDRRLNRTPSANGPLFISNFYGNPPGFMSLPNLVDQDGKVHLLVAEGEDFKRDIYYEVYNPDAANPTVPIVREFIEHQED